MGNADFFSSTNNNFNTNTYQTDYMSANNDFSAFSAPVNTQVDASLANQFNDLSFFPAAPTEQLNRSANADSFGENGQSSINWSGQSLDFLSNPVPQLPSTIPTGSSTVQRIASFF